MEQGGMTREQMMDLFSRLPDPAPRDVHYQAYIQGREDAMNGRQLELSEEQCQFLREVHGPKNTADSDIRASYTRGYTYGHARRMIKLAETWPNTSK
jgi:hypothetical protein